MAQKTINELREAFANNKEPDGEDFGNIFDSFQHKSTKIEQSQVLGLNNNLNKLENDKADKTQIEVIEKQLPTFASKEELKSVVEGLRPMGSVDTEAELHAIESPNDNDSYYVKETTDTNGDPYIWRFDKNIGENGDWVNTKQVVYQDVAKQSDIKELGLQPKAGDVFGISDVLGNNAFIIDKYGYIRLNQDTESLKSNLDRAGIKYIDDSDFSILDKYGHVAFKIDADGNIKNPYKQLASVSEDFEILDRWGKVAFRVSADGKVNYNGKNENVSPIVPESNKASFFDADIIMVILYGQSLSVQGSSGIPSDFYNSLTFNGGISLGELDPDDLISVDTFFESLVPMPQTGAETPAKGIVKKWIELIRDENGKDLETFDYQLLGIVPGYSGRSWAQLADKNGMYYRRLLIGVQRGMELAIAEGKTFNVPVLAWMQGENSQDKSDTIEQHYAKLEQIFDSLNADIKTITGQTNDVQFITYQIASFTANPPAKVDVPLAQLKISQEKENVHFGCAMYQLNPRSEADKIHINNDSVRMVGAMMGVQAKRIITDNEPLKPVYPKKWYIQESNGRFLLSTLFDVPVSPLVFDISGSDFCNINGKQSNYGFSIKNGLDNELIESVEIKRGDTLMFTCNENPKGLSLDYAFTGINGGGNLRDSQGDKVKIDINGKFYGVHNWCPIFRITI